MTATATEPTMTPRTREVLKRAGNPFRNYFARNPDDEVCARYHVPELFAPERDLLHAVIDLYRIQDRVAAEVAQAYAQAQLAARRLEVTEKGLRSATQSADKNLVALGQTKGAGDLTVLLVRPQEVVA